MSIEPWVLVVVVVVVLIAAALFYLRGRRVAYHVERALVMSATPQAVFERVKELRSWHEWSPWLAHDPKTVLSYSEQSDVAGAWYGWESAIVGSGRLEHRHLEEGTRIEQQLQFFRPWKSEASVEWQFRPLEGGTEVVWAMNSSLPWLLSFMKPMMERMIGLDYSHGLNLLHQRLNPEAEQYRIDYLEPTELPAQRYIFERREAGFDEIGKIMEQVYKALSDRLQSAGVAISGAPFAIFERVDLTKRRARCRIALPLPEGAAIDGNVAERPATRVAQLRLTGDYRHLEYAWYALMSDVEMRKLKKRRAIPPFEVYENDPQEVGLANAETRLYLPIR